MTNLAAIVKATRASASAIKRSGRAWHAYDDAHRAGDTLAEERAMRAIRRAQADRTRAQSILAANPLPGDPT